MKSTVMLLAVLLSTGLSAVSPAFAQPPVAEHAALRFHSSVVMNLHHTLFAAAWARRPEAGTLRALAGPLPSALEASWRPGEREVWERAVAYYDRELASRDLLFDRGMTRLKLALVAGDLSDAAVGPGLRAVLEPAVAVYERHFWPAHDAANRAWIGRTIERLATLAGAVVPRLEQLYGEKWFVEPVRVDVVWVGNRQGAYTTNRPTHVTISAGDPGNSDWTAVETVFHEVSHTLVLPLQAMLNTALGDARSEHAVLWHVIQFYLTGAAVQETLRARGIEYTPYMYATGLLDRAWGRYRRPVEDSWAPYLRGEIGLREAIARTATAVTTR